MASIHLEIGKPNWFCHCYDPEGLRQKTSTGTSNRRVAFTICTTIERAARLARVNKLTNEKALKMMREAGAQIEESHGKIQADCAQVALKGQLEKFVKMAGGELEAYTVRTWLETWLKGKTDASKATLIEYRRVVDFFLKFLGARANRPLTTVQMRQIEEFKASLVARVSPASVNKTMRILKSAFNHAVKSRQLEFSPAEHVAFAEADAARRRAFDKAEIKKLLDAASGDWRTMILLGYYTGLRLTDCASLTWRDVDLHRGSIDKSTKKTGRRVSIPIHDVLAAHLANLAGDEPDAPICPKLRGEPAPRLSSQFRKVMFDAGLVEKRDYKKKKTEPDARRTQARISFHSFRHSTTSDLKSAGVGDSVAMDIVGHETEAISRNYTDIPAAVKREAINKLPDVTK